MGRKLICGFIDKGYLPQYRAALLQKLLPIKWKRWEEIGKGCLVSMNELNMCQARVGGMCHLTNYSIFSTWTFLMCFQSGEEPGVCERGSQSELPVVAFPWALHALALQREGSKDPTAEQLAARGWPLAVAMVWNFPVLRIFRQQHTYKCVVKLDACRGRLGPPGLLTKPVFQWRSKFDFSPPSLSSSFSFPSSPTPPLLKRHQWLVRRTDQLDLLSHWWSWE